LIVIDSGKGSVSQGNRFQLTVNQVDVIGAEEEEAKK